jgi:hypothetical protein
LPQSSGSKGKRSNQQEAVAKQRLCTVPDPSCYSSNKYLGPKSVVPNLWYGYPWGNAADRFGVRENNIGNGGKHPKKEKLTQKQGYEVLVYKEILV